MRCGPHPGDTIVGGTPVPKCWGEGYMQCSGFGWEPYGIQLFCTYCPKSVVYESLLFGVNNTHMQTKQCICCHCHVPLRYLVYRMLNKMKVIRRQSVLNPLTAKSKFFHQFKKSEISEIAMICYYCYSLHILREHKQNVGR